MPGPFTSPVAQSVPFDPTVTNLLTGLNVQDAIDQITALIQGQVRLVLLNTYNSTWTNNAFLGRTELLPSTPIKLAKPIAIYELAFQNQNTTKNFFLDIYKNGQAIGNLVSTLTVNTGAGTGQTFTGLNLTFAANDFIFFRYRNISGTSPSDSTIELYCKVI
jgi:hypothetical protein